MTGDTYQKLTVIHVCSVAVYSQVKAAKKIVINRHRGRYSIQAAR